MDETNLLGVMANIESSGNKWWLDGTADEETTGLWDELLMDVFNETERIVWERAVNRAYFQFKRDAKMRNGEKMLFALNNLNRRLRQSYADLMQQIAEAKGKKEPVYYPPHFAGKPNRWHCTITKHAEQLSDEEMEKLNAKLSPILDWRNPTY